MGEALSERHQVFRKRVKKYRPAVQNPIDRRVSAHVKLILFDYSSNSSIRVFIRRMRRFRCDKKFQNIFTSPRVEYKNIYNLMSKLLYSL